MPNTVRVRPDGGWYSRGESCLTESEMVERADSQSNGAAEVRHVATAWVTTEHGMELRYRVETEGGRWWTVSPEDIEGANEHA